MAKKTINDLRPGDIVWFLYNENVTEEKVFSISVEDIVTKRGFKYELKEGDLTSWVFEATSRSSSYNFHLNKIDVLKLKHTKLEKDLEATYVRQQKYFELIVEQNKAIYNSNLEIINELKNQK